MDDAEFRQANERFKFAFNRESDWLVGWECCCAPCIDFLDLIMNMMIMLAKEDGPSETPAERNEMVCPSLCNKLFQSDIILFHVEHRLPCSLFSLLF